jgi:hypothetical protein
LINAALCNFTVLSQKLQAVVYAAAISPDAVVRAAATATSSPWGSFAIGRQDVVAARGSFTRMVEWRAPRAHLRLLPIHALNDVFAIGGTPRRALAAAVVLPAPTAIARLIRTS